MKVSNFAKISRKNGSRANEVLCPPTEEMPYALSPKLPASLFYGLDDAADDLHVI